MGGGKNEGSGARKTCPRPSFLTVGPCGPEMRYRAPLSTANRCEVLRQGAPSLGPEPFQTQGGAVANREILRSCCPPRRDGALGASPARPCHPTTTCAGIPTGSVSIGVC